MKKVLLTLIAFAMVWVTKAQFLSTAPTIDGTVTAGEYNNITNTEWYIGWDDTYLYVAKTAGGESQPVVMLLDVNPLEIVSGGTDSDGNLTGFDFDGITTKPPFRADAIVYFKNDYAEYRKADGSGGYVQQAVDGNALTRGFNATGSPSSSPAREIRIRWADLPGISGRPTSFNWCGYHFDDVNDFIYHELPVENPDGNQSTPYFQYYYTVSNTSNSGTTNPFSQTSFELRDASGGNNFLSNDITLFDITNNSGSRPIVLENNSIDITVQVQNAFRTNHGVQINSNETLSFLDGSSLEIETGGFLNIPVVGAINYDANSTLEYKTGTDYGRNVEWSSTSGSGYPGNVLISNNTTLNISNSAPTIPRQIAGSLTIESGSKLSMEDMTSAFTVLKDVTIAGELELSSAIGGDLELEGNFANTGTFTGNGRLVSFQGSTAQTIDGTNAFPYLLINNTAGVSIVSGTDSVLNLLTLQSGTFNTNDNLVLSSSATSTAMVYHNGGSVNGNATVERFITEGTTSYHFVAAPVGGATVNSLATNVAGGSLVITHPYSKAATPTAGNGRSTNPFPNLFLYDETLIRTGFESEDFGWETPATSSLAMLAGKGFMARMPANSTFSLTGTFNTGDFTVDVSNANGETGSGWNLIGNPYPSPIDWNDVVALTENELVFDDQVGPVEPVANAVYIFEPVSAYGGNYGSYINGTSAGNFNNTGLIPSMQGFFVRRTEASGNSTITFKNSVRNTTYDNPTFQRIKSEKEGLLRLAIYSNPEGVNRKDDLVVYFQDGATSDFDGSFDAFKFAYNTIGYPTIYTKTAITDEKIAINALAPLAIAESKILPITMWVETAGTQKLVASEMAGFDLLTDVYLEDRWNEKLIDLRNVSEYVFNAEKGHQENRFFIHFRNNGVTSLLDDLENEGVSIWAKGKSLQVQFATEKSANSTISLFDLMGRKLYEYENDKREKNLSLALPNFNQKMVIVRVEGNGKMTSKKIYLD